MLVSGNRRHLIMVGRKDADIRVDVETLKSRLEAAPEVQRDLARYDMGTLTEFFGGFVGSRRAMVEASRFSPPVTDDYPIMEYATHWYFRETRIPIELFDLGGVGTWCADCLRDGSPHPLADHLDAYLSMLGDWYASENFRYTSVIRGRPPYRMAAIAPGGRIMEAYRNSGYLQSIFSIEDR